MTGAQSVAAAAAEAALEVEAPVEEGLAAARGRRGRRWWRWRWWRWRWWDRVEVATEVAVVAAAVLAAARLVA